MDLWSLREICGRSNGFTVVQINLQSFTTICSRSAQTLMKKHAHASRSEQRASRNQCLYNKQKREIIDFPLLLIFCFRIVGATEALLLFLIVQLQRPALWVISQPSCAAENTPLRRSALCPAELHGRFRFSSLIHNKISRIRMGENHRRY